MHVDYVPRTADENVQRATGNNPKGKNFPLDCPLDELAKKNGKSERSIRIKVSSLREKGYIRHLNGKRYGKWDILIDIF